MARVFLSYDRDDAERARPLALALEKAGHSVWWDLHVRSGAQFSKVIEEALKAADAVVVLWSVHSVESAWVRDEAAAGRDTGRLLPVSLDDTDPPLGFRQFQTIDLSRWRGRGKPVELRTLFADVEAMEHSNSAVRPTTALPPAPRPVPEHRRSIAAKPLLIAAAILFVVIAGFAAWKLLRPSTRVATVAIEASEQTPTSRSLARDLLVKLGSLQASNASSLQIVEAGSGAKPDLIFEVAGNADGSPPRAGLVLLSGRDRSLFWSKEFEAPPGRSADLRQQLGFTAARVTGCAVEALNAKGKRLSQGTLKLYLNACAAFAETTGSGSERVVPMFRQITREAPAFEGGWTGLLLAELEVFFGTDDDAQVKEQIRKDVAAARNLHPNLIAIKQAEIVLLPYNAFTERMRLADRAVELGPNSPLGYAARSGVEMHIGRMEDSVADAQKAVQFDPLSPPLRDSYIQALLYAGRTDIALQELEKAERLWPGASNLAEARFRINLRYGDAREALRAVRSDPARAGWSVQSYLEARMDPSPPKVEKAIDEAREVYRQYPGVIAHVAQVYGEFGREKELLDILLKAPQADVITATDVIFRPSLAEFWKDPQSLLFAKRVGLLQFWQSSGKWPDFCNARDLRYDCKKEAARLLA